MRHSISFYFIATEKNDSYKMSNLKIESIHFNTRKFWKRREAKASRVGSPMGWDAVEYQTRGG